MIPNDITSTVHQDGTISIAFTVPGETGKIVTVDMYASVFGEEPSPFHKSSYEAGSRFDMNFGQAPSTNIKFAVFCYYPGEIDEEAEWIWNVIKFN